MGKIHCKGVLIMIQFFIEAALPKLSQTSLYDKYNKASGITEAVKTEFAHINDFAIKSTDIQDVVSFMRLNGDAILKKAIAAWDKGDIVVTFNPASKIPPVLPYIIAGKETPRCYVFGSTLMSKLTNQSEIINLMAGLEAGYIALCMYRTPNRFINNRDLVLALCTAYQYMVNAPLEQRLYMKGDNLVKAMLYSIAFFYKMIDGENMSAEKINVKRMLNQKVEPSMVKQIVDQVKEMEGCNFMDLLKLISNINPVRYKNLDSMYMNYFNASCGVYLVFALENPQYLMMLITSAAYKTKLTNFGLNKLISIPCKKILNIITSMV